MCLDTISHPALPATTMVQSGWKQFGGSFTRPNFQSSALKAKMEVPLDQWLTADEQSISYGGGKYTSGFHIYEDETQFKNNQSAYRRVYFRQAHTKGKQDSKTVLVAREMYVPSDPNAWPPRS